ncbi:MAG TPA: pseudouridine synthase [Burkholderiaceae bacterium]
MLPPPLPIKHGVAPSYLWLPEGRWPDMLTFLTQQFPDVGADTWRARMARGEVRERFGDVLKPDSAARRGMCIYYYREVEDEAIIPFAHTILHRDEHIIVADKPHFLPVIPGGRFLRETLLVRLKLETGIEDLAPLHRLDRETAGVVVFSCNAATRGRYQALFRDRAMAKIYEAVAPVRADLPAVYRSRIVPGTPFFRMKEEEGEPNAETHLQVLAQRGDLALYQLEPVSGRQHQLRVHMAALGIPILNDAFYPDVYPSRNDDHSAPLQLLARSLEFTDPLNDARRTFVSTRTLREAESFQQEMSLL